MATAMERRSIFQSLSPEIIDQILHTIRTAADATAHSARLTDLKNFSLTCRTACAMTDRYLFRDVLLTPFNRTWTNAKADDRQLQKTILMLSRPRIIRWIRNIKIVLPCQMCTNLGYPRTRDRKNGALVVLTAVGVLLEGCYKDIVELGFEFVCYCDEDEGNGDVDVELHDEPEAEAKLTKALAEGLTEEELEELRTTYKLFGLNFFFELLDAFDFTSLKKLSLLKFTQRYRGETRADKRNADSDCDDEGEELDEEDEGNYDWASVRNTGTITISTPFPRIAPARGNLRGQNFHKNWQRMKKRNIELDVSPFCAFQMSFFACFFYDGHAEEFNFTGFNFTELPPYTPAPCPLIFPSTWPLKDDKYSQSLLQRDPSLLTTVKLSSVSTTAENFIAMLKFNTRLKSLTLDSFSLLRYVKRLPDDDTYMPWLDVLELMSERTWKLLHITALRTHTRIYGEGTSSNLYATSEERRLMKEMFTDIIGPSVEEWVRSYRRDLKDFEVVVKSRIFILVHCLKGGEQAGGGFFEIKDAGSAISS